MNDLLLSNFGWVLISSLLELADADALTSSPLFSADSTNEATCSSMRREINWHFSNKLLTMLRA